MVLITKDINLRIKGAAIGIQVEDYNNDQVLEDVNLLYSGVLKLPDSFWDLHDKEVDRWTKEGHTYHKISGDEVKKWQPNKIISIGDDNTFEALSERTLKKAPLLSKFVSVILKKKVFGVLLPEIRKKTMHLIY